MLFDGVGVCTATLSRLDGEQLALIVPFVERRILIEAFVTLQPDQFSAVDRSQSLCDFGLADAGFTFEQQRPLQEVHQP